MVEGEFIPLKGQISERIPHLITKADASKAGLGVVCQETEDTCSIKVRQIKQMC